MAGTGIVWPADAVSSTPTYTGRMLRNTQAPFLAGATPSRPLGAISGVRPGTPPSTVVATSAVLYTVSPFAGIIDLETAAIAGPYAFAFNQNVTGAITPANGANPRVDAVYVQISDSAESDGTPITTPPSIKVDYLAGTVNSSGTLVIAAVPPRSFVIANINVPISGGGSPTVTWVAPYAASAGGIVPTSGATQYPPVATLGQYIDDANRGLMRGNGTGFAPASAQQQLVPSVAGTGVTVSAGGTVTATAATGINLSSILSTAFDHYFIDFNITAMSVAGSLNLRMRLGGTDDASANYSNTLRQSNAGSTSSGAFTNGSSFPFTAIGVAHWTGLHMWNPAIPLATRISATGYTGNTGGVHIDESVSGAHALGVAYDGLTILPSNGGTITGTIAVYGYNKG